MAANRHSIDIHFTRKLSMSASHISFNQAGSLHRWFHLWCTIIIIQWSILTFTSSRRLLQAWVTTCIVCIDNRSSRHMRRWPNTAHRASIIVMIIHSMLLDCNAEYLTTVTASLSRHRLYDIFLISLFVAFSGAKYACPFIFIMRPALLIMNTFISPSYFYDFITRNTGCDTFSTVIALVIIISGCSAANDVRARGSCYQMMFHSIYFAILTDAADAAFSENEFRRHTVKSFRAFSRDHRSLSVKR